MSVFPWGLEWRADLVRTPTRSGGVTLCRWMIRQSLRMVLFASAEAALYAAVAATRVFCTSSQSARAQCPWV